MTRSSAVGTLEWTRETRGLLRNRDRAALIAQALRYGLATLPWELRRVLGITRGDLPRVDPAKLAPPDSRACRDAEELLAEMTSPMVANHSLRTFAWGAALAAHDNLSYDREGAYVTSLLQDLFWEHPRALPGALFFTLPAPERAAPLWSSAVWDEDRSETV